MSSRSLGGPNLSRRFVTYYTIAYLVMISLMGVAFDLSSRAALLNDVDHDLEVAASLAQIGLTDDESAYQQWADESFERSGFRFTLIRSDGVVLSDSHLEAEGMENHANRSEVRSALEGSVGLAVRTSASTGFEQRYVAIPPIDDLVVRASVPTRTIASELATLRRNTLIAAVLVGMAGVLVILFLARRLARPITELTTQALAVAGGATEVSPPRSRVLELDQLGGAISSMADRLSARVEDVEEASATLELVLRALPQGTILVDGSDRLVYANNAADDMLGSVPAQLSTLAPLQLQELVREVRATGEHETVMVDRGLPPRRLRAVATPFSNDDRVLLLVADVTDRERTDSIRRDFVANASHELKTPVSTIIASSEALQISLSRADGSAGRFATRIEDSARQLDRLVGDLLDLSRLERDDPEREPERIDLLAREEVERIRPVAEDKKVGLDFDSEELVVLVSRRDLSVAIRNLLDNAVRYTEPGGRVEVDLSRRGGHAVLSITDSGEGIPTRDLERVFERFYRVDTARSRQTGGTGLGLAIAKHVTENHGGSISVTSELGVGSTFVVRLPLSE